MTKFICPFCTRGAIITDAGNDTKGSISTACPHCENKFRVTTKMNEEGDTTEYRFELAKPEAIILVDGETPIAHQVCTNCGYGPCYLIPPCAFYAIEYKDKQKCPYFCDQFVQWREVRK